MSIDHANSSGYRVFSDDLGASVHIHVRYKDGVKPEEIAAKLAGAYREACGELEIRLGPIRVD